MPWKETKDDQAIALYKQNGKHFVLFFASGTPPWCPDCRDAQPHLESVFKADDAPVLHVVRVGEREQWKTPSNKWRAEPYRIGEIPTLVRLEDGKEVERLGEHGCKSESDIKKLVGK